MECSTSSWYCSMYFGSLCLTCMCNPPWNLVASSGVRGDLLCSGLVGCSVEFWERAGRGVVVRGSSEPAAPLPCEARMSYCGYAYWTFLSLAKELILLSIVIIELRFPVLFPYNSFFFFRLSSCCGTFESSRCNRQMTCVQATVVAPVVA